jgi:pilus assembly protein Flp/PilA
MREKLLAFLKSDSGATAIEYGLIAAVITVVIIAALGAFGDALEALFVGNEGSVVSGLSGGY